MPHLAYSLLFHVPRGLQFVGIGLMSGATASTALYLRLLSVAFLSAFLSAYVQLPGLLGFDGLEPAASLLERARPQYSVLPAVDIVTQLLPQLPTLTWFHALLGVSVDAVLDMCCLAGALVSLLAVAGVQCGLGFAIMYAPTACLLPSFLPC
jgi:hypothetical protein